MNNIIPFPYEGQAVRFSLDGWAKALAKASEAGKQKVIYCVQFSHGVIKVGRTSNMRTRLKAISSHGINNSLVKDLFIEPVSGDLAYAEGSALRKFSELSVQLGPEIFQTIEAEKVAEILATAAAEAATVKVKDKERIGPDNFDSIAQSSGMYEAFIYLAIDRAEDLGQTERAKALRQIVADAPAGNLGEIVRLMIMGEGGAA